MGLKKYGVTLERTDLSLKDWLQHAYEECLDQANYLKRAIFELELQDLQREAETQQKGFYKMDFDDREAY